MKHVKSVCTIALFTFVLFAMPSIVAGEDHEHHDIIVARTSTGQLTAEFHFHEEHTLPPVSGVVNGYSGDHPGFGHLHEDEPEEGLFMLADGAAIYFEIVGFETAFQVWGSGLTGPYDMAGEQILLGDEHLHTHIQWHINSDDPGFDLMHAPWTAEFRLVDQGTTGYAPSETFELMFVPEPTSAALLFAGALGLIVRRK